MDSLPQEVQKEVSRVRSMLAETKRLLPNGRGNFIIYETILNEAEKAVRDQDVVALVKILPELQEM